MNTKQWFATSDLEAMLEYLKDRASTRKLRLFAVACCLRFRSLFETDVVSLQAVETAELFADGRATTKQLRLARTSVAVFWGPGMDRSLRTVREAARATTQLHAVGAALDTSREVLRLAGVSTRCDEQRAREAAAAERCAIRTERQRQIATLHHLFGNPFRPVTVEPGWLTSDVLLLARGIYTERAFDRMPILADALQDAGCTSAEMLTHLRAGTDHARGCWVLDALLGNG
jgi:hypothetical protein